VHGRFDGLAPSGLQGLNPATLTALSPTTYQTAGIETRLSQIVGYDGQLGNATAGLDAAHLRWFAFDVTGDPGQRPRTRAAPWPAAADPTSSFNLPADRTVIMGSDVDV